MEWRAFSPTRCGDEVATRSQHSRRLGEERREVELSHEIEGVVRKGERGCIGDSKGNPPVRVESNALRCLLDHRFGYVDTPDTAPGEFAGGQKSCHTGARSEIQGPLRLSDMGQGDSEGEQEVWIGFDRPSVP